MPHTAIGGAQGNEAAMVDSPMTNWQKSLLAMAVEWFLATLGVVLMVLLVLAMSMVLWVLDK
jgi:hypothetical protein